MICYDKEIDDWRTICLFNFDHMESLKETGKKYPMCGKLKSYSSQDQSGFIFIADDTIVGKVTFTISKPKPKPVNQDGILDEEFLHVLAGNAF